MGTFDTVLYQKRTKCPGCNLYYVYYQRLAFDDSHETGEVIHCCPRCSFSSDEKFEISAMRNEPFIQSAIPKQNLEIILKEVRKLHKKLPEIGWDDYNPSIIKSVYDIRDLNYQRAQK